MEINLSVDTIKGLVCLAYESNSVEFDNRTEKEREKIIRIAVDALYDQALSGDFTKKNRKYVVFGTLIKAVPMAIKGAHQEFNYRLKVAYEEVCKI